MVVDVTRSHIEVEIEGKTVNVPGEMFFPPNGKMGFAVFLTQIDSWNHPHDKLRLTESEIKQVLEEIRSNFSKGGHVLEIED